MALAVVRPVSYDQFPDLHDENSMFLDPPPEKYAIEKLVFLT